MEKGSLLQVGCWMGRPRETLSPPHHPPGQVQAAVFPRADISSTPSRRKNKPAVGPQLVLHPRSLDPPIHIMGIKERGPSDANGKGSINGCIEEVLYFSQLGSSNKNMSVQCPSPKRRFWGAAAAVGNSLVIPQKVKYRITWWPGNSTPSEVKVTQLCLTVCDLMDYRIHVILQARILEWVAFPFSSGASQPRNWTEVSSIAGGFFTSWATREAQEYGVGSLSLLQWSFPTQELNRGLWHCRQILYQLSYQGSLRGRAKRIENSDLDTCVQIFIAALFTIIKRWEQPKGPSIDGG